MSKFSFWITSWLTGLKVLFPSQDDVNKPREKSTEVRQSPRINNRQEDRNEQEEIKKRLNESRAKLQEFVKKSNVEKKAVLWESLGINCI